jgi:hypothetical protein
MRVGSTWLRIAGAALGGLAAMALVGCGLSGSDGITGPSTVSTASGASAPDTSEGGVSQSKKQSESRSQKVTICHKGSSLSVSWSAVPAHLRHGDRLGECAPRPVDCPCFSQQGINDVSAVCASSNLSATCPVTYSLQLFCAPGGTGGVVGNLGYFAVTLDSGSCTTVSQDPVSGDEVVTTLAVTQAQYQACRQALVTSDPYPASCPQ